MTSARGMKISIEKNLETYTKTLEQFSDKNSNEEKTQLLQELQTLFLQACTYVEAEKDIAAWKLMINCLALLLKSTTKLLPRNPKNIQEVKELQMVESWSEFDSVIQKKLSILLPSPSSKQDNQSIDAEISKKKNQLNSYLRQYYKLKADVLYDCACLYKDSNQYQFSLEVVQLAREAYQRVIQKLSLNNKQSRLLHSQISKSLRETNKFIESLNNKLNPDKNYDSKQENLVQADLKSNDVPESAEPPFPLTEPLTESQTPASKEQKSEAIEDKQSQEIKPTDDHDSMCVKAILKLKEIFTKKRLDLTYLIDYLKMLTTISDSKPDELVGNMQQLFGKLPNDPDIQMQNIAISTIITSKQLSNHDLIYINECISEIESLQQKHLSQELKRSKSSDWDYFTNDLKITPQKREEWDAIFKKHIQQSHPYLSAYREIYKTMTPQEIRIFSKHFKDFDIWFRFENDAEFKQIQLDAIDKIVKKREINPELSWTDSFFEIYKTLIKGDDSYIKAFAKNYPSLLECFSVEEIAVQQVQEVKEFATQEIEKRFLYSFRLNQNRANLLFGMATQPDKKSQSGQSEDQAQSGKISSLPRMVTSYLDFLCNCSRKTLQQLYQNSFFQSPYGPERFSDITQSSRAQNSFQGGHEPNKRRKIN